MQNSIHQKNNTIEVPLLQHEVEERKHDEEYAIITCKKLALSSQAFDVLMPMFFRPGRHFVWGVVLQQPSLIFAPAWWGLLFMVEAEEQIMKQSDVD